MRRRLAASLQATKIGGRFFPEGLETYQYREAPGRQRVSWPWIGVHVVTSMMLLVDLRAQLCRGQTGEDRPFALQIKRCIDPKTGLEQYYTPHGRFVHVLPSIVTTVLDNQFDLPWWLDPQYVIGLPDVAHDPSLAANRAVFSIHLGMNASLCELVQRIGRGGGGWQIV